jgi:hypothetical protein
MKINKNILAYSLMGCLTLGVSISCSDSFLDTPPPGVFDEKGLTNRTGIEGMLINAYASMHGASAGWYITPVNWVWGSVTAGDAYKGSEKNDQADVNPIERFEVQPSSPLISGKWDNTYNGVGRANQVLQALANATDLSDADKTRIQGEARFLRGFFHFEAKKVFGKVPFVPEGTVDFKIPNDAEIWDKIEADFKYGYDNLPGTMNAVGRANKWTAAAYLAKTLMFEQKYAAAKVIIEDILANGTTSKGVKYALNAKFNDNFSIATENSSETIFAMQFSTNDGSTTNGNYEMTLAYPAPNFNGCCGFYQPTQDLVDSYRTSGGLPIDNYNAVEVASDDKALSSTAWDAAHAYKKDEFASRPNPLTPRLDRAYKALADNTGADPLTSPASWVLVWEESNLEVDPRLDWTVGRRGIPFLDYTNHPGNDWIRAVSFSGPYSPIKNTWSKAEAASGLAGSAGWGWNNTSENFTLLRLADVILWGAECEAEVGTLAQAATYVNMIRTRAANPAGFVKELDAPGTPAANYVINNYTSFADKAAALKAIRFERKLELAMEGHRFFDLVRWGTAETEINAFLAFEGAKRAACLGGATFAPKNKYMPIPQYSIIQSTKDGTPTLKQNPGYPGGD